MKIILIISTFLFICRGFSKELITPTQKDWSLSPKINLGVNLNSRSSSNKLLPSDTDYPDSLILAMGESIHNKIKIEYNLDSTKYIEVSRGDKIVKIMQGENIYVRTDSIRCRGVLGIIDDSTLLIDDHVVALSEIHVLAKPSTKKTVGLILAALPLEFYGVIFIMFGSLEPSLLLPGLAITAVTTSVVVSEALKGKRYRGKQDKWKFYIKTI